MNTLSKYVLLLLVSVLAACGSDDDAAATFTPGTPQPGDALAVTITASDFVTDGDPDTRATDKGPVTTFEDGDRVGIIILDKAEKPLYNNIPYKYVSSSQTWEFDNGNGEGKEICYYDSKARTYIVYYPYSAKADGCKNESDLKAIFKPQTDQSTKDAYRASDLMVNTITTGTPLKSLTASLKHVYASISLAPTAYTLEDGNGTKCNIKVSDANLTIGDNVYVPYQATDGSLRCIVPASITPSGIRCFYTFSGTTYGNTISISGSVAANTRYTSAPEIISKTYTLDDAKVGDFYCKRISDGNGYLIPSDVVLTVDQKNACIGIVYCTDINRIGDEAKNVLKNKGVDTPHGLVMALTNASNGCRWGNYGTDENNGGAAGTPFRDNTSTLRMQYNNVDGYGETHWILKTYSDGTTLRDTYTAFYHASRYGTAEGGTSRYATPNTTTGWFLPSMGQWWDILSYLGRIDLTAYRGSSESDTSISGAARTAVDNMNKYSEKIDDATPFNTGTYFWSSSEYSSRNACDVDLYGSGNLHLYYYSKGSSYSKVRCVFAF